MLLIGIVRLARIVPDRLGNRESRRQHDPIESSSV
jgi:hypothetical protein